MYLSSNSCCDSFSARWASWVYIYTSCCLTLAQRIFTTDLSDIMNTGSIGYGLERLDKPLWLFMVFVSRIRCSPPSLDIGRFGRNTRGSSLRSCVVLLQRRMVESTTFLDLNRALRGLCCFGKVGINWGGYLMVGDDVGYGTGSITVMYLDYWIRSCRIEYEVTYEAQTWYLSDLW